MTIALNSSDENDDRMSHPPILQADNLGRCAADAHWLIRNVSLSVCRGQQWAVTGPTGCGKTVLLRTLAMLDQFDEGQLLWNGAEISNEKVPSFRRSVVYLHQRPALVSGSVEDNLRLPFQLAQADGVSFDHDAVMQSLQQLGRDTAFLKKSSDDLSGGEAQIVALLRAMHVDPAILLLDEPTAALDANATQAVESLVSRWLNDSPTTRATLWVTHDTSQLQRVADQVLAMESISETEQGDD
jgi:putative ABC transport system ATP-binding protein